jgi:N-acetylglucosaminyldiphosphoundecaprenol N-acetyl-beta-D-mannosaminyltransferase
MFKEYFGIRFEFDHAEVDRIIEEYIWENKPGYVCSLDGTNFSIAMNNPDHLRILNEAIVNNCDSTWVPTMVNRIHDKHYKNYCGADLFIDYIKKGKFRQFFLGSNREVLDGLKKEMSKLDPKVATMRFEELPFRKVEDFDYQGIADMINADAPDIIWVSLGAPKQENFMNRLQPYLKRGVMFGFGAIFNFYSGLDNAPKRAPQWMINLHLEWLDRIFKEPKKQIKRCSMIAKTLPKAYMAEKRRKKILEHNIN